MGTWARVVVVDGPPGALRLAQTRIEQLEARWSRFRPDSEVSRLNRSGGRPVVVSADTARLVDLALAGHRGTAGRFDPTLLGPLVNAGYDRLFDRLGPIAVPPGPGFDPGGIGKGLAADIVVGELLAAGASGACVNLGGDLRAEGAGPWLVDVADPFDETGPALARLAFDAGGVATSSRLRRAWTAPDGTARHHLIDPTTGQPAATGVAAVTVLTGDGWRAEVLAKAALLAGLPAALDVLATNRATGLVVDDGGGIHHAPGLDRFLA
jgi:thiamine biosynthesis lipoprotein